LGTLFREDRFLFLRRIKQLRKGQSSTYYAIAEPARAPDGRVRQRTICYLGRLDNLRPPDWLRVADRLPDPAWLPLLMAEVGYTPPSSPSGQIAGVTVDPGSIAWRNHATSPMSSWPGASGNCSAWINCSNLCCAVAAVVCRRPSSPPCSPSLAWSRRAAS
jgi:hypothetical protein